MRSIAKVVLLGLVCVTAGCRRSHLPEDLTGAGSTFVNPLMVRWASEYKKTADVPVTYHALGSSGGIAWMTEKKADFGCTDGPMTEEQLAEAGRVGGAVVHIPLVMGAVVPAYNVAGLKAPLRFTGSVLADIYLGKIKKWNDKALTDLNPDAGLPDRDIIVVHRADGSGTTFVWTDYLSKVSPEWKTKVGAKQAVEWSTGVKQDGNDGVAEHVKKTPGSIGYIELAYAFQMDIPFGLVQNREKQFVKASLESVTAAGDGMLKDLPADLRYSLTDAPGKLSYPICGTTWAVAYVEQPSGRGQKVADFLYWVLHDGQQYARELLYARLPPSLVERAEKQLERIKTGK